MKVLKFGGTSVGSVQGILNLKKIVKSQNKQIVVVVSALSGVTDQLYHISKIAASGDESYLKEYDEMFRRHMEIIHQVISPEKKAKTVSQVQTLFADLLNIFRGIYLIKDISTKITDTVVSYGEMISSVIIANVIENAVHFDLRTFIKTKD